jgi:two-component system cell cycle sensor histidine kinase/response regulator CckA
MKSSMDSAAQPPPRVLIVDDERHNRQLLEVMLAPEGYVLLTADCGEEALAVVALQSPDLILLDVMMPGMDGFEVVGKIKGDPATTNIPIILVTALDDRAARMRGLAAGAEDFLSKPVDRAELCVRVRNLLRLRAYGEFHDKRSQILEREVDMRTVDLRHERDRAQRYLDTATVILLALDTQGRVTLANRFACAALGWTEAELLGRDWFGTCIVACNRESGRQRFSRLLRGDGAIVEVNVLTRSGDERLIEWHSNVMLDDDGQVIGLFNSGIDITDRNRAVESLRAAEERMRFALTNSHVGIWDMDYTTKVLQWSDILEAQYGLLPGTFAGTFEAFIERVHADDRELVLETIGKALKDGRNFSMTHRTVWPDGTERWVSGTGRMQIDANGEPVRGVGVSIDITERRVLEAQYQQAQKMEAIGRLAGGVAHDFNNLLTVMLGYCELLLADLDPDDPRHEDVMHIQRAGTSGASLTRQLLAFSRKRVIEPTLLDLNIAVASVRTMLSRLIGDDVTIVLTLRPELSLVKADRGQLEQIVMNLAVNARDAMPGGGTLTIETANVELDEDYARTHLEVSAGPYVVLTMTDTGTGMTPQVQARLFEPFFTTKDVGKGTGLGLATVHGLAKQNGGGVNVHSEVGKGTSFKVYLPRADTIESRLDAPIAAARARAETQTVLVVEDAEGLRELARRLLQRQGYTVLVAANSDEALRLFERHTIDVLLTDVVMPGASGPELTRRLIDQRPALKVVYMSGYTEEAIAEHGVLDPRIAFLHKPFSAESLGTKIRGVIDR